MIFILMISFTGAVIESASIQTAKNLRRTDVNRAIESVFAEYQKDLWEQYGLFALEGSYESGSYSEDLVTDRLDFYGASNMEHTIERIRFLTDDGARVFYQQAVAYIQHLYGADFLTDLIGQTDSWRQQEQDGDDFDREMEDTTKELDDLLEENEAELPEEDNPISHISNLKKSPILSLVMQKNQELSDKAMDLSGTVSHRELNQGYGDFSDQEEGTVNLSSLLFGQYLLDHFSTVLDAQPVRAAGSGQEAETGETAAENESLSYEIEYLIAGKESDKDNLKSVVNRLMGIRTVDHIAYLEKNTSKKNEVRVLATSLCSLLPIPGLEVVAIHAALLAWAFGESLVDLRSLLKGNRVPLTKSDKTWQLSLSGLLKLGEGDDPNDGADDVHGLSYRDYIRMLLFSTKKEDLAVRALDLIEINLQNVHGLSFFKADQCITKLGISSTASLRRGVSYQFPTYFGYL